MIEFMPESNGKILGVRVSGKLTDDDYRQVLIPKFQELLAEHGKLSAVFYMDEEFHGWESKAAWDDAKFGVEHRADFEKLAVVGGPRWVKWGMKLSAHIMHGEIRTFPSDQLQEAWDWVKG